jgi:hypothetical protein
MALVVLKKVIEACGVSIRSYAISQAMSFLHFSPFVITIVGVLI